MKLAGHKKNVHLDGEYCMYVHKALNDKAFFLPNYITVLTASSSKNNEKQHEHVATTSHVVNECTMEIHCLCMSPIMDISNLSATNLRLISTA